MPDPHARLWHTGLDVEDLDGAIERASNDDALLRRQPHELAARERVACWDLAQQVARVQIVHTQLLVDASCNEDAALGRVDVVVDAEAGDGVSERQDALAVGAHLLGGGQHRAARPVVSAQEWLRV